MKNIENGEYISVKEFAKEIGLHRINTAKYIKDNGFNLVKVRLNGKGQLNLALTQEDANTLLELRRSQGFIEQTPVEESENGYFYMIQLIPGFFEGRIKLGFTNNVEGRLSTHKTSAPTAKLLKAWPCKRSWEIAAIASITKDNCKLISNEVYDCDNVEMLLDSGELFFNVMPQK